MSKITVIRHAPTIYNKKGIFMGVLDIPLFSTEDINVEFLKKTFSDNGCKLCYTSPLKRSYGTAALLFEKDKIITDQRLMERDLGSWAGLSKNEIQKQYPHAFKESGVMDFYYTPKNGEHYQDVIRRVADLLLELHALNSSIAIVAHNGVFRVMKSLIQGISLSTVFDKFEPHLDPQSFCINDELADKIKRDCFYTVDQ